MTKLPPWADAYVSAHLAECPTEALAESRAVLRVHVEHYSDSAMKKGEILPFDTTRRHLELLCQVE